MKGKQAPPESCVTVNDQYNAVNETKSEFTDEVRAYQALFIFNSSFTLAAKRFSLVSAGYPRKVPYNSP